MSVAAPPSKPRSTYWALFSVSEFRFLSAGMMLYVLGFEFQVLGLSVLVYAKTHSAFLAALVFSVGFLPQVAGGALFTSVADRLPPRVVITAGLLARAAPGLVIGFYPAMPIAAMLILAAAAAVFAPVFGAASARLLVEILDGDRYILGRSVFSLISSGGQLVGLGIGGAVLAALSTRWLLIAAGGSLTVAALIACLGLRSRAARAGSASVRGVVRSTFAGNAKLLADSRLRGLLLAQWLPVWLVTGAESLIVPYVGSLGKPASAASALLAALPAGILLGNVIVGRFCRPSARQQMALPLAMLMGIPLLSLVFHPPLLLATGVLVVSGLGFSYGLAIQQAFVESLPSDLRGQGFGLSTTGAMGGQGLIPPAAGGLAATMGAGAAMAVAGAATIFISLALHGPLTGWKTRHDGFSRR